MTKTRPGPLSVILSSLKSDVRGLTTFPPRTPCPAPSWPDFLGPPHRTQWSRLVQTYIAPRAATTPTAGHVPSDKNEAGRYSCQENSVWTTEQGAGTARLLLSGSLLDIRRRAADPPRFETSWAELASDKSTILAWARGRVPLRDHRSQAQSQESLKTAGPGTACSNLSIQQLTSSRGWGPRGN